MRSRHLANLPTTCGTFFVGLTLVSVCGWSLAGVTAFAKLCLTFLAGVRWLADAATYLAAASSSSFLLAAISRSVSFESSLAPGSSLVSSCCVRPLVVVG